MAPKRGCFGGSAGRTEWQGDARRNACVRCRAIRYGVGGRCRPCRIQRIAFLPVPLTADTDMPARDDSLYAAFAEVEDCRRPLLMTGLTFARLVDEVIVPRERGEAFFLDGVEVTRAKVRQLKVVRQGPQFEGALEVLHNRLHHGPTDRPTASGRRAVSCATGISGSPER